MAKAKVYFTPNVDVDFAPVLLIDLSTGTKFVANGIRDNSGWYVSVNLTADELEELKDHHLVTDIY
jgi:hypothetical protein